MDWRWLGPMIRLVWSRLLHAFHMASWARVLVFPDCLGHRMRMRLFRQLSSSSWYGVGLIPNMSWLKKTGSWASLVSTGLCRSASMTRRGSWMLTLYALRGSERRYPAISSIVVYPPLLALGFLVSGWPFFL